MTNEQIERAAETHADELKVSSAIPGALVPMLYDIAKTSYICGAQDALASQWISVEERLPEEYRTVLAYIDNDDFRELKIALAHWDGEDFYATHNGKIHPSHWLPIPQLNPEKEER